MGQNHRGVDPLAGVIAEQLKANGIKGREASRATGIKHSTLNRRLTGTGSPFTSPELFAIAELLGTTVSALAAEAEAAA